MKKTQSHLETARPCESYPNGCKKCALRQWCVKLKEEAEEQNALKVHRATMDTPDKQQTAFSWHQFLASLREDGDFLSPAQFDRLWQGGNSDAF